MREVYMSFGSNLRALRTSKKMTQGELSKLADIELAQISRIEREATQPKLETIRKLAIALECSTDSLIFDEHEKTLSIQAISALKKIDELNEEDALVILDVIESYCSYKQINEHFKSD